MTGPEPDGIVWHKSSYSGSGSACVEVARVPDGVLVRDSKDPDGSALTIPTAAWQAFLVVFVR